MRSAVRQLLLWLPAASAVAAPGDTTTVASSPMEITITYGNSPTHFILRRQRRGLPGPMGCGEGESDELIFFFFDSFWKEKEKSKLLHFKYNSIAMWPAMK